MCNKTLKILPRVVRENKMSRVAFHLQFIWQQVCLGVINVPQYVRKSMILVRDVGRRMWDVGSNMFSFMRFLLISTVEFGY